MDRPNLLPPTPETCSLLLRLLDGLEEAIMVADRQERVVYANPASERARGYPLEEILGLSAGSLWREELPLDDLVAIGDALRQGHAWTGVMHLKRRSGVPSSRRVRILPLESPGDSIPFHAGIALPVDGFQHRPEELLEQVAFLEQVLEAIPYPVYVKDRDLRFRMCNTACARLFSTTSARMRGKLLSESGLVAREFALLRETEGRDVLRTGQPHESRVATVLPDGIEHHALSCLRPLLGTDGQPVGLLGVLVDVTELHSKEQHLAREHARVSGESMSKTLFLANVSHEIRTPLNAILGQLELLAQSGSALTPLDRERVERAAAAGESLRDLVDKVLEHARAEGGMLEERSNAFLLRDLLWALEDRFRARARDKGIGLLVEIDPQLDGPLVGDGIRLSQALSHLVDNAVKFTASGGVVVAAKLLNRRGDQLDVRLSVSDTGIGMPAEVLPHVGRPFHQVDSGPTRRFGGTGLGLSLCRRLVEFLGGCLDVESEPGRGSVFHVDVPLRPGSDSSADDATPRTEFAGLSLPLEGLDILLVGPESWRRGFLVDSMVGEGATVHVVDAFDARRVREQVAAQSPDALLVQLEAIPGPADRFCEELSTHDPGLRILGIAPAPGVEPEGDRETPRWPDTLREPLAMEVLARTLRPSPEGIGQISAPRRHSVLVDVPGRSNESLRRFLDAHRGDLKNVVVHLRNTDIESARAVVAALSEAAKQIGAAELAHRARRLEGSLQIESGLGEEFSLAERAFQNLVVAIDELDGGQVDAAPPPPPYPGATSPAHPELIDRIKSVLRAGDAEILDLLETEETALLVHLGSSGLRGLVTLVRTFDFDGALALLRQSFPDEVTP